MGATARAMFSCARWYSVTPMPLVEGIVERAQQQIGVLALEDERRPDLQNVVVWPSASDQHATLAHTVDKDLRTVGIGIGCSSNDDLDADCEPNLAHLTDRR